MLLYWERFIKSVDEFMGSSGKLMEEAPPKDIVEFVDNVLQQCLKILNYTSVAKMSPKNALIVVVNPLVKLNPYRLYGNCIFLFKIAGIWIENHFVVLAILYYALQTSNPNS